MSRVLIERHQLSSNSDADGQDEDTCICISGLTEMSTPGIIHDRNAGSIQVQVQVDVR